MSELANQELQRSLTKLKQGSNQEEVLHELCHRLVHKLTHVPSVGLKQAAIDGHEELLTLIHYLYQTPKAQSTHEEIA